MFSFQNIKGIFRPLVGQELFDDCNRLEHYNASVRQEFKSCRAVQVMFRRGKGRLSRCFVFCISFLSLTFTHTYATEGLSFAPDLDAIFEEDNTEEESFPAIDFELSDSADRDEPMPLDWTDTQPQESQSATEGKTGSSLAQSKLELEKILDDEERAIEIEGRSKNFHESGFKKVNESYLATSIEDKDVQAAVHHQWDDNIQQLLTQARVAAKTLNYQEAEEYYIEALNRKMADELRVDILFEMAAFFSDREVYSKESATLEKFLEIYPHHSKAAQTYMRLGFLYRKVGAPETALDRFFHLLHMSLGIPPKEFEAYKLIVRQAQIEIAHTYFLMKDYEKAVSHYNRLKFEDLSLEDQKIVLFRAGYSANEIKNYHGVLGKMELFIQKFGKTDLAPEAHHILANVYKQLNRPDDAVREVRKLLNEDLKDYASSRELWMYWKKRTANKVANEFYEQGDYMNALKIYQTMVPVNLSPEWQWPIIYQIGLCFEQLGMYPKAHQAYTVIMNSTEWEIDLENLSEALASIKDMASWRQDHLKWVINSEFKLRKLIKPTTADIVTL